MSTSETRGSDSRESETLAAVFAQAGRGIYPPFDGLTEVVPRPASVPAAVFAFTGHHIVAAEINPEWVQDRCPPGDLLAPISPGFLLALGDRLGCRPGSHCLVLCAAARPEALELELISADPAETHRRIARAQRYRTDIRVFHTTNGAGLLTVGRGISGRWEAGFEVTSDQRNQGLGRALASAALHLIEPGAALFMEVAIGNVASIRTVLAAGFVPIGAQVLFVSADRPSS